MNRFQFVQDHKDAYGVKRLCEVVEVTRSSNREAKNQKLSLEPPKKNPFYNVYEPAGYINPQPFRMVRPLNHNFSGFLCLGKFLASLVLWV